MTFEELKDEGQLTYKDLVDCIEHELIDIDKNTTKEEVIERYEQFQIEGMTKAKTLDENDPNRNTISVFSIALDFILVVAIKRFYNYLSINLFNLNLNALGDIDDAHWSELIDVIKIILKMSKDNGKIISLDQCIFIHKDELN